jgi:uncharacterized protein YutE (UPF0331/DUF86 family)
LVLTPKQEIELVENANERTAGQLLKALQTVVMRDPTLEKSLKTGLRVRNVIVHRFFNVNILGLFEPDSRDRILDELRILKEAVMEACAKMNDVIKIAYKRFDGTDIDALQQEHRLRLEEQERTSVEQDEVALIGGASPNKIARCQRVFFSVHLAAGDLRVNPAADGRTPR